MEGTGMEGVGGNKLKMNQGPGSEINISPLSFSLSPGTLRCGDEVCRVAARTAEDSQILAPVFLV